MECLEDKDKKEKLRKDIREISKQLATLTNAIFNLDRENPEVQSIQLDEAAKEVETLINRLAQKDFLNSVCLKVFVGAVQVALKSFYDTLKDPTIVRPEDMH